MVDYNFLQYILNVLFLDRNSTPSYQILNLVDVAGKVTASNAKTTPGRWATWISTNRFCHVESDDKLVIKNLQGEFFTGN